MKRRYKIPFGAKVERDGVRFRLWAPRTARASLHLEGDPAVELPMEKKTDGTLVLTTAVARPGTRYRYLADGNRYPDPASRRQRMESTDQARLSIPGL
jgi:maltooligosyltrehalose trehalohydrolase